MYCFFYERITTWFTLNDRTIQSFSLSVPPLDTLKHSYTAVQAICIHVANDGVLCSLMSDGERLKVRLEVEYMNIFSTLSLSGLENFLAYVRNTILLSLPCFICSKLRGREILPFGLGCKGRLSIIPETL